MPSPARALLVAAAIAALPSCSYRETYRATLDRLAPADGVTLARACVDELRAGRIDDVERRLDPAIVTVDTRQKLEAIALHFPRSEPRSVELIGSNVVSSPDRWAANLTFQYEFEGEWVAVAVALKRSGDGPLLVHGFHVNGCPTPCSESTPSRSVARASSTSPSWPGRVSSPRSSCSRSSSASGRPTSGGDGRGACSSWSAPRR